MAKRRKTAIGAARKTEVDAYVFIKETLKELGWDVRNPARSGSGQVYTQNECLEHPGIRAALNRDRPENVVKIADAIYWVIEAKSDQRMLGKAISEAEDYARRVNEAGGILAPFISGVAGNQATGYLMETRYLVGKTYRTVTFNGKPASSLLAPAVIRMVLEVGPTIDDVPVDEHQFLTAAERINEFLHLGAINKNQRARLMAALLLSLVDDTPPNVDAAPSVLIAEINARAKRLLATEGKPEFFSYIRIALPTTEDNHVKFKTAIVNTIQELRKLNIRSAMNSGTDVLGKFYEVFLKYGNGAKEIGIVLTPRHVTAFAVDVLGIGPQDIVFDPTCGTAGFLVAAFDAVKKVASGTALKRFRLNNILGIEQDAEVVALAMVNMIFRGDGKNKIVEGNCFQRNIAGDSHGVPRYTKESPAVEDAVVTRVLMNPPFALKSSDEKEFKFVDHALKQMAKGGLLFAILPYPSMVRDGVYKHWREHSLLRNNTLLSVMTFHRELFYPADIYPLAIIVKQGVPHPASQGVLWLRLLADGLLKHKRKRLPSPRAKNDFETVRGTLKAFVADQSYPVPTIKRFQRVCPINLSDPMLELVPENYLSDSKPTDESMCNGMTDVLRSALTVLLARTSR
jgi:type I restriction-modification system DNA methylase subunit